MKTIDWKNATPEQIIFWNKVRSEAIFSSIVPFCFQGLWTGSIFETYVVGTYYAALQLDFGGIEVPELSTTMPVDLRGFANSTINGFVCDNSSCFNDPVAAKNYQNQNVIHLKNIAFSWGDAVYFTHINFIGYILTV